MSILRILITPQACISSATCCGISSMRSIVYHQAAGRSTLKRDEIQPEGLMICTARGAVMICQASGLDKKIPKAFAFGIFWHALTKKMPTFIGAQYVVLTLKFYQFEIILYV